MLLSSLLNKPIFTENIPRGVCAGVGFSLKTGTLKYLFCSENASSSFAVPFSSLQALFPYGIRLSKLRPVLSKQCARLSLGLPVYTHQGIYLGDIVDGEVQDGVLVRLRTDQNQVFPLSAIQAHADAILLKKSLPYPLGQQIPASALSFLLKKEATVSKSGLKNAIQNKALIRLTLSLAPFSVFNL